MPEPHFPDQCIPKWAAVRTSNHSPSAQSPSTSSVTVHQSVFGSIRSRRAFMSLIQTTSVALRALQRHHTGFMSTWRNFTPKFSCHWRLSSHIRKASSWTHMVQPHRLRWSRTTLIHCSHIHRAKGVSDATCKELGGVFISSNQSPHGGGHCQVNNLSFIEEDRCHQQRRGPN
jgi:hypothetical protein